MVIVYLVVLGLCLGSFVNALVWRLHEQSTVKKTENRKQKTEFSILYGRSMCPHCKYNLKPGDLVPVLSWLWLRGKCRNCKKPISKQYPLVELITAGLFVASYLYWPSGFSTDGLMLFSAWLLTLTAFMALTVYDLRWMLLPDRIIFPLGWLWLAVVAIFSFLHTSPHYAIGALFGALVGGGIFWVLFQASAGRWIGGGDVKLGFVLGLIVASPLMALFVIFIASYIGTLVAIAGLAGKKHKLNRKIPFGPSLITATVIVFLFQNQIVALLTNMFML